MAGELVYTSARRGLRPGTRGFCTVAYTRGMLPATVQVLESLSAYKSLHSVHDPKAPVDPLAYSHYRYTLAGRNVSILSRVGPAQADHTQRTNKLAHHVVLSHGERAAGGPAWLCSADGFFLDTWEGEPRQIGKAKQIPAGDSASTFAAHWKKLTGDAGWAGVLAYAFLSRPAEPAFVVFEPGMDMLSLMAEAQALLAPERRWQVTFSTHFCSLPAGTTCSWRCCVPGSECLRETRRGQRSLYLDLTRPLGELPENPLVKCARDGTPIPTESEPEDTRDQGFVTLPNRHQATLRMKPVRE